VITRYEELTSSRSRAWVRELSFQRRLPVQRRIRESCRMAAHYCANRFTRCFRGRASGFRWIDRAPWSLLLAPALGGVRFGWWPIWPYPVGLRARCCR